MNKVIISREWVRVVTHRSARDCWTYYYTFNGGMPPAVKIPYGTNLAELRRVLRQRYPTHAVSQEW